MQLTSLYAASLVLALASAAPPTQINFSPAKTEKSLFSNFNHETKADSITMESKYEYHTKDGCWRACFFDEPTCPESLESKRFGNCWTCCSKAGGDATKSALLESPIGIELLRMKPNHDYFTNDNCWRACFSEKPTCPERFESKKSGDCWICCLDSTESTNSQDGNDRFRALSQKASDVRIDINIEENKDL